MISILMTTQKYIKLPTPVRSNINLLIAFNLMKFDWKKIEEEVVYLDKEIFENIRNYTFKDDNGSEFLLYNIDKNLVYKKFDKIIL